MYVQCGAEVLVCGCENEHRSLSSDADKGKIPAH